MTDVVKHVDRGVPPTERMLTFTQADGGTGDVFMVSESLGGPATRVSIDATAAITVRFNVYRNIYPKRLGNDLMHTDHLPNLALGERVKDNEAAEVVLGIGETFNNDGEFPVRDVEVVSAAGDFEIFLS